MVSKTLFIFLNSLSLFFRLGHILGLTCLQVLRLFLLPEPRLCCLDLGLCNLNLSPYTGSLHPTLRDFPLLLEHAHFCSRFLTFPYPPPNLLPLPGATTTPNTLLHPLPAQHHQRPTDHPLAPTSLLNPFSIGGFSPLWNNFMH